MKNAPIARFVQKNTKLLYGWIAAFAIAGAVMMLPPSQAGQNSRSKPIVIGVILSESGPADFIGLPEKRVLELLLEEYKKTARTNHDIVFRFLDSGGKVDLAKSHFERLEKDGVLAIIGPSTSGESIEVAKLAEKANVPLLSLAASRQIVQDDSKRTRKWVFKFAQNDNLAAEKLVWAIKGQKHSSVALLYSDDGFGKSGATEFENALKDAPGLTLVSSTAFPRSLDTPEPYIAALPAATDALVIWGTSPGPAQLVRAAQKMGARKQIYLSHGNASTEFITSAGPSCEGAIIIGSRVLLPRRNLDKNSPADNVVLEYQSFWTKNLNQAPSHFGGHARDAFEMLLRTLDRAPKANRVEFRDKLEDSEKFFGVTGVFNFGPNDHAGLDLSAFETYVIKGGRFNRLSD